MDSRPKQRRFSPLRAAYAEALAKKLTCGWLPICDSTLQHLRLDGWTRAILNRAVDDLVEAGRARLELCDEVVVVHAVGTRSSADPRGVELVN